jgi:hypothetical protein
MIRLKTYVQISDLHFGDIDPMTFQSAAPAYWSNSKCFDGLPGHDYVALQRLVKFFRRMKRREDAELIVTGDLTSIGKSDQFDAARDFLGAQLIPPKGTVGLGVADWQAKAIPGNHDYFAGAVTWTGGPILGGPTAGLAQCFPKLPFATAPIPLPPTSVSLRFASIDTDAANSAYGPNRFWARGSFVKQLTDAQAALGPPERDEIRVLLLHHSRAHNRGYKLRIDRKSAAALDRFLAQSDIAVLLSGHMHVPWVQNFQLISPSPARVLDLMEARCGTTTQRDTIPLHWFTLLGIPPNRTLEPNTLMVHRLIAENRAIFWTVQTYTRRIYGFEPFGLTGRQAVWPRPP